MRLVLASASPRRAELLRAAGFAFEVYPVEVDERLQPGERPDHAAARLAQAKAHAAAAHHPGALVLGADTIVVVEGDAMGKPAGDPDAKRMLRRLSGRTHDVLTGISIGSSGHFLTRVDTTRVTMSAMTEEEIDWYVATGEPRDKAGAYAVQGLASRFVSGIDGSYSNVVGLPVSVVYTLIRQLGYVILGHTKPG